MSRRLSVFNSAGADSARYFAVVCCFFVLGSAAGIMSASAASVQSAVSDASDIISDAGFLQYFLSLSKYHLISAFLGLMLFGFVFIPLLSAVKGFFLSFTVSCLSAFGGSGLYSQRLLVFAGAQLVSVVLLLFLMSSSMQFSMKLTNVFLTSAVPLKKLFGAKFVRPAAVSLLILFILSFLLILVF